MNSCTESVTAGFASRICITSPPPMPAAIIVCTSPGSNAENPSDSRRSILSDSPSARMCSLALSRGPALTSMAISFTAGSLLASQMGMYPWSVPISATEAPSVTRPATADSLFDSSIGASFLIQIISQFSAAARMPELAERLRLNLTDTLSRDIELFSHFLQGAGPSVVHAKTKPEHLLLPVCQGIQHLVQLLLEKCGSCRLRRNRHIVILDEISQMAVLLLSDG